MTQLHLEFLVEPFVAGDPGPHVGAAVEAVTASGVDVEVGPFANVATGSTEAIAEAVAALLRDAFGRGATRVSVVAGLDPVPGARVDTPRSDPTPVAGADAKEFLAAVRPVVRALGASVLRPPRDGSTRVGDIALRWQGRVVGVVRAAPLTDALDHLIGQVEDELGGALATLDRVAKQQAVSLLHERGAFALRRSTDAVAEAMGVSRITIYNYLNALETDDR